MVEIPRHVILAGVIALCIYPIQTSTTSIRLVNGNVPWEGRVEVYYNGWGTVCDDSFGEPEARVVCRMLGYGEPATAYASAHFGQGSGYIQLDDLDCNGRETDIVQCKTKNWREENCEHSEDVGVRCTHVTIPTLVGGGGNFEGTVQINYNGRYYTFCDTSFTDNDANVVCKSLGFPRGIAVNGGKYEQISYARIMSDGPQCAGTETKLQDCPRFGVHTTSCTHAQDAGVLCEHTPVRLVGGSIPSEGLLQVQHKGVWSTVCSSGFDSHEADVVCRMLGFNGSHVSVDAHVSGGSGAMISGNLGCQGSEFDLSNCSAPLKWETNCSHTDDVGLSCRPTEESLVNGAGPWKGTRYKSRLANNRGRPTNLSLVDGSGPWEGTLQIKIGNQYGPTEVSLVNGAGPWEGTLQIKIGNQCGPTEVSLVNGAGPWEGTLQIRIDGRYGTVCDPDFSDKEADVVCRMLGYTKKDAVHVIYRSNFFGSGSTPLLDNITCTGNEHDISACAKVFHGSCPPTETVGLRCEGVQVRLADGAQQGQGRVEILHAGEWGSVCDSNWDDKDATVICRMLYPYPYEQFVTGKAVNGSMFGYGSGRVWLSDVSCHGNESDVTECARDIRGGVNCDHSNDAGVVCNSNVPKRLTGGVKASEGTVEFLDNRGVWNSYCDEDWNKTDGRVICTEMGYWNSNPTVKYNAVYGYGNGSTYKTRPDCKGTEGSIEMCHDDIKLSSSSACSSTLAVGLACNPRSIDNSQIRLVDGPGPWKGRLEVRVGHGKWGGFCYDHWNQSYTDLVCKTLHYVHLNGQLFPTSKGFGAIHYQSLDCATEATSGISNLGLCRVNTNVSECSSKEAVGIDCSDGLSVKLENNVAMLYTQNSSSEQGVCFSGINNASARVLCSMAGYQNAIPFMTSVTVSNNPVAYTNIQCDGWERHISQCTTRTNGTCTSLLKLQCFNCSRTLTSSAGTVLSNNYDQGKYNPDEDCLYIIQPPGNMTLKLTFHDLDLYGDGDYIEIHDGYKGRQLGFYNTSSNVPTLVSSNGFYIRFKTNSIGQARGFNVSWSVLTLQDAVQMGCGPDGWDISVNTTILRHLYPDTGVSQIKLSDQQCVGVVYGDKVQFKQPYTDCSTNIQTDTNNVVYSNELVYPEASSPFPIIIRGYRWKVEVECDVPRVNSVSTGFSPNRTVGNVVPHVTGSSQYSSTIKFFTDGSFYKEVQGNPVSIKTGDDVFVKVQLNSNDPHVKMRLHTCYAKPEMDSPPSLTYTLIQNGCVVDSYTSILSQGIHDTRFVFNAFEFPAGHDNVYISCNATYCKTNDVSSACNQICIGAPSIVGRSLNEIVHALENDNFLN